MSESDRAARNMSRLGLGCARIGSFSNPAPRGQIRETIALALDLGVTVFDTADIYGQGDSERELGRALKGRCDKAMVVTKIGKLFSKRMRSLRPFKPLITPLIRAAKAGGAMAARRDQEMRAEFKPDWLTAALDASLKRLGFNHVDGLMLHNPSADDLGQPRLAQTLEGIKTSGKARFVGVSCDEASSLHAALQLPALDLLELPIDLIDEAAKDGLTAQFASRGIAVLATGVVRLQPHLSPAEAVARASARDDIDCVVVGLSHPDRLKQAVAACRQPRSLGQRL